METSRQGYLSLALDTISSLVGQDQLCLSNWQNDTREGGPANTAKTHRLKAQAASKMN